MANLYRIYIKGRVPYDIVQRGNENVKFQFAMFSSPCWGFRIKYGKTTTEPVPETKGVLTYYDFEITGEEAMWWPRIEEFVKDLKAAGAQIRAANVKDIEEERSGGDPGEEYSILMGI